LRSPGAGRCGGGGVPAWRQCGGRQRSWRRSWPAAARVGVLLSRRRASRRCSAPPAPQPPASRRRASSCSGRLHPAAAPRRLRLAAPAACAPPLGVRGERRGEEGGGGGEGRKKRRPAAMWAVVCRDCGLGFQNGIGGARFCLCEGFFRFFSTDKAVAHCQTQVGAQVGAGHLRKWEGLCPMTIGP
jgi:hypothetical protein